MTSERKKKTALYLNMAMVAAELVAFLTCSDHRGLLSLAFYTILSNIFALCASALFIFSSLTGKLKREVVVARYVSVFVLFVTFCVTTLVLVWFTDPMELLFSRRNFIHHLLLPVLSFVSYMVFEDHICEKRKMLAAILPNVLYGITMIVLNVADIVDGPYPFFMVQHFGIGRVIMYFFALLIFMILLALGLYWLPGRNDQPDKRV